MTTETQAAKFASDWIDSWNQHSLDKIMKHYDDNIEFHSPFIKTINFNEAGVITSKVDLLRYFKIGLEAYPDLEFKFHNIFTGINTVVIYYTSVNGRFAAEVFHLNNKGRAIKVFCNYSNNVSINE